MSLFRTDSTLRYIFYLELILLVSAGLAFVLSLFMVPRETPLVRPTNRHLLFSNYKVLQSLIHLKEIEPLGNTNPTSPLPLQQHPLLQDLKRLDQSKEALEKRQFTQVRLYLNKIKSHHSYVNREKKQLLLTTMYQTKRYQSFISTYKKSSISSSDMRLRYLNSLWRTGKKGEAQEIFKVLFSRRSLRFFQKEMTRSSLTALLSKLDTQYWYNKCLQLLQKGAYREFLRERNYIKNRDLRYLFSAEFHYTKRRYKRAKRLLEQVKDEKYAQQIHRLLLKMELRNGHFQSVRKEISKLKNEKLWYTSFLFNAASLMLAKGESDEAIYYFSEYVKFIANGEDFSRRHPRNPAKFWKAHWLMAWLFYKQRDMRQASLYFKRGKSSPIIPYRIASVFWLSKIKDESTDTINFYPYSFYFTKIKHKNHIIGLYHFVNLINGEQSTTFQKILAEVRHLIKYQMIHHCIPYIKFAKESEGLNWSDKNMLGLLESIIHLKQGNYFMAFTAFKRNFPQYHSLRLPHFLSFIYFPAAYQASINRFSRLNRIDNLLVYALIRNESFFNPNTVSPARAHGLMQLVYRTARQVARKLRMRLRRRDLFNADINIQLGIEYLKQLLIRYQGNLALTLAAYNAGPTPVDRWRRQFGHVTAEEFIEMIPYSETRTYVKNILRNYYYYKFYYRPDDLKKASESP